MNLILVSLCNRRDVIKFPRRLLCVASSDPSSRQFINDPKPDRCWKYRVQETETDRSCVRVPITEFAAPISHIFFYCQYIDQVQAEDKLDQPSSE